MHDRYADPDPADVSNHDTRSGEGFEYITWFPEANASQPLVQPGWFMKERLPDIASDAPRTRALHAHASPRPRSATHRAIGNSWAIGQGITRPGPSQRVRAAGGISTHRRQRRMARKRLWVRAYETQQRALAWRRAHPLVIDWWRACLLIGAMLLFLAGCWAVGVLLAATGTWQ